MILASLESKVNEDSLVSQECLDPWVRLVPRATGVTLATQVFLERAARDLPDQLATQDPKVFQEHQVTQDLLETGAHPEGPWRD